MGKIIGRFIGQYKIRIEGHDKPLTLKALTMIDPETGWFEIVQYNIKQTATIENLVKQTRSCRYICPTIITYNCRNSFLGHTFKKTGPKQNLELKPNVRLRKIHKLIQY